MWSVPASQAIMMATGPKQGLTVVPGPSWRGRTPRRTAQMADTCCYSSCDVTDVGPLQSVVRRARVSSAEVEEMRFVISRRSAQVHTYLMYLTYLHTYMYLRYRYLA